MIQFVQLPLDRSTSLPSIEDAFRAASTRPQVNDFLILGQSSGYLAVFPPNTDYYYSVSPEPFLPFREVVRLSPDVVACRVCEILNAMDREEDIEFELFCARRLAAAELFLADSTSRECLTRTFIRSQADRMPRDEWGIEKISKPKLTYNLDGHFTTMLIGMPSTTLDAVTFAGSNRLPNVREVEEVVFMIRDLIFVGRDNPARIGKQFQDAYEEKLLQLGASLQEVIECTLRSNPNTSKYIKYQAVATSYTQKFIDELPVLRQQINSDIVHARKNDPAIRDTTAIELSHNGIEATWRYRVANCLHRIGVPRIPVMMQKLTIRETSADIHPAASIAAPFFIDHGVGVVIGETCEIGPGCIVYANTVLGAASFPKTSTGEFRLDAKRHPTLEADVIVYSFGRVLGDITIGAGSIVGIGSEVWESIPKEHIVHRDCPPKPIRKKKDGSN